MPIDKPIRLSFAKRAFLVLLLLVLLGVVIWFMIATPQGQRLREDPHKLGVEFREWVIDHPVIAPVAFLGAYIVASMCLLPVWWLLILAGAGFGLWSGCAWSLAGASCGAACSFMVSRTLAANWVRQKFEARHARLRELDEKMGHNGLIIVMAARLIHFLPFGISNYLFGLSRINLIEVVIGTLLGNIPATLLYVAAGAGIHPWRNWRFMVALTGVNLVLLVPVAIRYWRPGWFRKIGVE